VTVDSPPAVVSGDVVDIFTSLGNNQVAIGHHITIENIAGPAMTILVDTSQEYQWISVAAAKTQLHIVKSTAKAPSGNPTDSTTAIQVLCGAPCVGNGGGATPAPSASATPTPKVP
jgi:hypothetical protein